MTVVAAESGQASSLSFRVRSSLSTVTPEIFVSIDTDSEDLACSTQGQGGFSHSVCLNFLAWEKVFSLCFLPKHGVNLGVVVDDKSTQES